MIGETKVANEGDRVYSVSMGIPYINVRRCEILNENTLAVVGMKAGEGANAGDG